MKKVTYGPEYWIARGRDFALINIMFLVFLWLQQPENKFYPFFIFNFMIAATSAHRKFKIGWIASLPISCIYLSSLLRYNLDHLLVAFIVAMSTMHFIATTWAILKFRAVS